MRLTEIFHGRAGSSLDYLTGSWRTGTAPRFLYEKCNDCKMCLFVCPEGIIWRQERAVYQADYEYCKGCGICAEECPLGDIVMVPEEEVMPAGALR